MSLQVRARRDACYWLVVQKKARWTCSSKAPIRLRGQHGRQLQLRVRHAREVAQIVPRPEGAGAFEGLVLRRHLTHLTHLARRGHWGSD